MAWDDDLDPNSPAYGIAGATTRYVRVVAGPGTGKSFALKRRVARLLEHGAPPDRILPVTFTNVAAEDLQREMLLVGVAGCEAIRGSTLHALCMKILSRQHVSGLYTWAPHADSRVRRTAILLRTCRDCAEKRGAKTISLRGTEALERSFPGTPPHNRKE